jgi:hypothetical protein
MAKQGDLGERAATREQQAKQWEGEFGLKDRAQQAQMEQFAKTHGLSEQQLAAQINQWAAQNGISKEQIAAQIASATIGANATVGAAQAQAGAITASAQMQAALKQREIENAEKQQDFDMYWKGQMNPIAYQNALMNGMTPSDPTFAGVNTPTASQGGASDGAYTMANQGVQNQNAGTGQVITSALGGLQI